MKKNLKEQSPTKEITLSYQLKNISILKTSVTPIQNSKNVQVDIKIKSRYLYLNDTSLDLTIDLVIENAHDKKILGEFTTVFHYRFKTLKDLVTVSPDKKKVTYVNFLIDMLSGVAYSTLRGIIISHSVQLNQKIILPVINPTELRKNTYFKVATDYKKL